jgi:uncharacterized protein YoxC
VKIKFLFILLLFSSFFVYAQGGNDADFKEVSSAISNKDLFVKKKDLTIAKLKKELQGDINMDKEYALNAKLYSEYKKFKIDSAIYYVKRNIRIAGVLKNKDLDDTAQIQLVNLYSSSGKYREAEAILKSVNRKQLSEGLLALYFETYSQFFEHYATNSYNEAYFKCIEVYRDSLLSVLDQSDAKFKINTAQHNIYFKRYDTAEKDLLSLLAATKQKNQDYAMYAYLLGDIYKYRKNTGLEKKYYTIAAVTDIENANKDNAAIQNLAMIYYESGDVDKAYICTKSALEDAIFCNVKFRTLQMSELYSIINKAYLDKEAKGKSQLQTYLILISILSLFLIVAVVYVYKQMKKVSRIREELSESGKKLAALNDGISRANKQLQESNAQLSESNHIKEEYIAQFFDLCSTYISKLESYRITLNKKAVAKQHDELFKMLKSTTMVDTEVEELYNIFDSIFLNLYPTFVKDFNALLIKEEQVVLKQGELLNTELRIFALIRLGITDSVKIAAFLRYSLSTIYNYRTKARNKAAVSRDEFEIMVSRIGILPGKTQ